MCYHLVIWGSPMLVSANVEQPDVKALQIQLTGFLEKDTAPFCKELWNLFLSAQSSPQGVPKELLEAKKLELIQEKVWPTLPNLPDAPEIPLTLSVIRRSKPTAPPKRLNEEEKRQNVETETTIVVEIGVIGVMGAAATRGVAGLAGLATDPDHLGVGEIEKPIDRSNATHTSPIGLTADARTTAETLVVDGVEIRGLLHRKNSLPSPNDGKDPIRDGPCQHRGVPRNHEVVGDARSHLPEALRRPGAAVRTARQHTVPPRTLDLAAEAQRTGIDTLDLKETLLAGEMNLLTIYQKLRARNVKVAVAMTVVTLGRGPEVRPGEEETRPQSPLRQDADLLRLRLILGRRAIQ